MPVALKLCGENRQAPVFFICRRGRFDQPARVAGAGSAFVRDAKEESGDAMILGREGEPSRCREVEDFRLAGDFENDRGESGRRKPVEPRAQSIRRVGGTHQNEGCRIKPKALNSRAMDLALLERGIVLPNPEKVSLLRFMLQAMLQQTVQHKCSKTARRSAYGRAKNLVKSTCPKPSAKHAIHTGMAQGNRRRGLL